MHNPESFSQSIESFLTHLRLERGCSNNTLRAYRKDLQDFRAAANPQTSWDLITATQIYEFVFLSEQKPKTCARRHASVRAFYRWMLENQSISFNPAAEVKAPFVPFQKPDCCTQEEIELLLAHPDDTPFGIRDRAILHLLYFCALRVEEVTRLRMQDWDGLALTITTNRKRPGRQIIVEESTATAINNYLTIRQNNDSLTPLDQQIIFHNLQDDPITSRSVLAIVYDHAKVLGINTNANSLRNSRGAHLVEAGIDVFQIANLMGVRASSLARYSVFSPNFRRFQGKATAD